MMNGWQALRRGESARDRRRLLAEAHERFTADPALHDDPDQVGRFASQLRPVVFESWLRSRRSIVDPNQVPDRPALDDEELRELRVRHPIGRVLPVVQRLLFDEASDSGLLIAVGDAAGRLLWVDGDQALRARAEEMGFRAGMDWSERAVGTSAPGSALVVDHAIQVLGAEHYNRFVHPWSCTAVPVHDPDTAAIIGVIDVTGGDSAASPHILPLVEATLAAVEAELKVESLRAQIGEARPRARSQLADSPTPRLMVLGRHVALLDFGSRVLPLGGRHAEILLALAAAPRGLRAAELADQVYGDESAEMTLRPEVVRLRRWLEHNRVGLELHSRPYRLSARLRVDAAEVLSAISRGAHRLAFTAYEGPVLPGSDAPVVAALRADVDTTLREAMLQSAATDLLYDYAQNWAAEDVEPWEVLLRMLPPHSPKRARVVAKLETLS